MIFTAIMCVAIVSYLCGFAHGAFRTAPLEPSARKPMPRPPRPPRGRPVFTEVGWVPRYPEHSFLVRLFPAGDVADMPAAFRRMVGKVEDDQCDGV